MDQVLHRLEHHRPPGTGEIEQPLDAEQVRAAQRDQRLHRALEHRPDQRRLVAHDEADDAVANATPRRRSPSAARWRRSARCRSGVFGSMSPFTATSIAARGLRSSSIARQLLDRLAVGDVGLRDDDAVGQDRLLARLRRLLEIFQPVHRVDHREHDLDGEFSRRARGRWRRSAGSGSGRRGRWFRSARGRNAGFFRGRGRTTSRRSVFCKSVRVLQHRQPLPSSVTSSLLSRSSASSMPSDPNSLTISAVPLPSGVSRNRRTSVVFPAPRNPVTIVTGSREPRSRFCRRPKPATARETDGVGPYGEDCTSRRG